MQVFLLNHLSEKTCDSFPKDQFFEEQRRYTANILTLLSTAFDSIAFAIVVCGEYQIQ